MTSILTNNGAMVALQTLKSINNDLSTTQNQISTGKDISNAKDNSAVWAISKVMESDVQGFKAVSQSLSLGESTVSVARGAAESVTDTLKLMKEEIIAAQDGTVDRSKINDRVSALRDQIAATTVAAQLNGINLVQGTLDDSVTPTTSTAPAALSITSSLNRTAATEAVEAVAATDPDGDPATDDGTAAVAAVAAKPASVTSSSIVVEAIDLSVVALSGEHDIDEDGTTETLTLQDIDVSTADGAKMALQAIDAMISKASDAAASFGSAQSRIESQSEFVSKLSDTMKSGIGSLVDADMEEASARLKALQTQQQLGVQSLSIANQAPGAIMSLFR